MSDLPGDDSPFGGARCEQLPTGLVGAIGLLLGLLLDSGRKSHPLRFVPLCLFERFTPGGLVQPGRFVHKSQSGLSCSRGTACF